MVCMIGRAQSYWISFLLVLAHCAVVENFDREEDRSSSATPVRTSTGLLQEEPLKHRARAAGGSNILLRTGVVDTRLTRAHARGQNAVAEEQNASAAQDRGTLQLLVRLRVGACTKQALEALLSRGRVLYHVSRCSFAILTAGREEAFALSEHGAVAWVGPMLPRYKVAPELLNAGECPLLVQLEPPLCDSQHTLVDAETKLADDDDDEERRDRDCRLSGREWAARQAARWVQAMQLLGAEVQSATSVIVSCRNEDMTEVAHQLASDQYVHWIDRHMPIKKRNYHAAYNNQASEMQVDVGAVWARGIDGSGEVIHTADSGVDVGHCMFHDSKVPVPYDKVDTTHRKLVAYWTGKTGDRYDAKLGHGTHVAATIAGSLEDRSNSASKYQGLAPGAKLAVSDFEIETATDEEGAMIFGDIVDEIYTKPLKEAGAAVQSHSWGTQEYTYTSRSAELDKFLNANREALFVWAAGNDGGSQAMQTVGSPATAKNCLSVGATLAGIDATVRLRDQRHTSIELGVGKQNLGFNKGQLTERADLWSNEHVLHLSARGPCKDGRIKPDIILPGLVQSAQSNGRLDNFNCCLNPKCWLNTKCLNDCSGHGQCDLTTAPDVYSCLCEAGYCGRDCSIKTDTPAINRCCPATAETLCTSSYNGFCKTGNTGVPSSFSYPACQCSGDSEGVSCQETRLSKLVTIPKMGTSMAAPVGAGLAALVRQYFRNGFYPSGMLNVADGFTPSGALLKAMLLTAAAQPRHGQLVQLYLDTLLDATDKDNSLMAQVTSDCKAVPGGPKGDAAKFCDTINASMRGFPNGVQGFGRPLVEAVLYFSRASQGGRYRPSPLNLFISDSLSASNASVDSFCFYYESRVVKAMLPLTATVTWMDPPASPAALQTLVNDLDLEVVDTCGMVLTGNSEVEGAPTPLPPNTPRDFFPTPPQRDSSGTLRDRVNNVERVILRDGGLGCGHMARTVRIRVRAHYVPVGPQPYALAVTSLARPCQESVDVLSTVMASVYVVVDVQVSGGVDLNALSMDELRGSWASALRLPSSNVLILSVSETGRAVRVAVRVDKGQTTDKVFAHIEQTAQSSAALRPLQVVSIKAIGGGLSSAHELAPSSFMLVLSACVVSWLSLV